MLTVPTGELSKSRLIVLTLPTGELLEGKNLLCLTYPQSSCKGVELLCLPYPQVSCQGVELLCLPYSQTSCKGIELLCLPLPIGELLNGRVVAIVLILPIHISCKQALFNMLPQVSLHFLPQPSILTYKLFLSTAVTTTMIDK